MFGEYNVENAVAVTTLSILEGLTPTLVREALLSFGGTRERQEILGTREDGVTVIRDYAHHPTAVSVTLSGMRQHYPDRRLITVFEPLSASSKRKVFEERYGEALASAEVSIIIAPPIKEGEDKKNYLDTEHVKKLIENQGRIAQVASNASEALSALSSLVQPNDVVIFMSSGDLSGIPDKFVSA
jgi:UDP-N-acetylmuramate: L-alanyl-gamma-D-glutamyl-meso-diaminopimelate ligase